MTYDPEIEKLLPWYAKGLLEPDEQKQVDAYLADHPDMRMQLGLINEEIAAVEQQHAALGAPGSDGFERLIADIDRIEAKQAPITDAVDALLEKVRDFFSSFSRPGMQFAGIAAAVVIVVQGVVISTVLMGEQAASVSEPGFRTASGPEQAAPSDEAMLLIAFKPAANMAEVAKLLKTHSAKIVGGPKAGGFFEIAIPSGKLPEGGVASVVKALKETPELVQFVSSSQ